MKKILLLMTLFAGLMSAQADNTVVVNPVTVPQGGTASFDIELNNDVVFTAFTMELTLPDGITYDSKVPGSRFEDHGVGEGTKDGKKTFSALSGNSKPIKGNSGTLITVYVTADAGLAIGTELNAKLSALTFTTPDEVEYNLPDVNFTITIGDSRIVFNENSATLPVYTAGEKGNVRMNRTINANEWGTLVLPFTLTKAKAEAAFGTDVRLAEFTGFETEYADDADVSPDAIRLNFTEFSMTAKKGITGGKPYLIKTTKNITGFEADDVTLFNAITDATATDAYDTGGKFTGTLVASKVPADGLFISGEMFWYSIGATDIKAFRCWFESGAVLNKDTDFGVKMFIHQADDETGIEEVQMSNGSNDGEIYDLAGRRVEKANNGIYIINNKKVLVK
ncbi:MAG: hypothetical protein K6F20_04770 [Bacteroidaceae bacterium]|nr:hypothetical protein [Bacteroidaceae bacterium]